MKKVSKFLTVVMILTMLISNGAYVSNAYAPDEINDIFTVTHSEISSEEKYIESLASKLGISYKEAYEINKKENEEYLSRKNTKGLDGVTTYGLDEIIAYKTLYGSTRIKNTSNYVEMAIEVKYVYSQSTGKALEIMSVGSPHMYVYGVSHLEISGGDYNIESSRTSARISRTASMTYRVTSSAGISVGGDVISIEKSVSGHFIVTTRAKTYVLNITLNSF